MSKETFEEFKEMIRYWAKDEPYFVDLGENLELASFETDDTDSHYWEDGTVKLVGTFTVEFKSGAIQADAQKEKMMKEELKRAEEAIRAKYE